MWMPTTPRSVLRRWLGRAPEPVLQASPAERVAICEYNGWHGFMLEVLYPNAIRVSVAPGDAATRLVDAIPDSVRGVLVNLNASLTRGFIATETEFAAALAERGQRVFNLEAVDIRKSTLHACAQAFGVPSARAAGNGPDHERLIVKSTLNHGGAPERILRERWGDRATSFIEGLLVEPTEYAVLRRDHVPEATWTDPALVVERFIENPEGIFLRVYVVGPAAVVSVVWVNGDIKKLSTRMRRRHNFYYWDQTPLGPTTARAEHALTATRRMALALHIDFLGADCVTDADGAVVVVNVNKTPYWGHPRQSPILAHLRHGFDALVGDFT